MRPRAALLIVLLLVGGCAATPPVPPECTGKLVPINDVAAEAPRETKREARP